MAAEGASKVMKYLMFCFNFIFFVCGIVIVVAGALVFTKYNEYVKFTEDTGNAIPIVLMAVGGFILVTGFLGCCGAIRENYCLICIFAVIIVLLLLAEVAGGIAGYVKRDDIKKEIETNMKDLLADYENQTATRNLFDKMQKDLECCGIDSGKDYGPYLGDGNVPDSCCMNDTKGCGEAYKHGSIYTEGCFEALSNLLENYIVIIASVAIVIAFVQIFGVVCACCLMRSIKSEYEVV